MSKCCAKYSAGMLKEPVTFERVARVPDGGGGATRTWSAISGAPTFAMVKALSGGERWASSRTEATASHKVVIRYFDDLTEADSVVVRGRRHNIRFINNVDFADRWLEITTQQGAAV